MLKAAAELESVASSLLNGVGTLYTNDQDAVIVKEPLVNPLNFTTGC